MLRKPSGVRSRGSEVIWTVYWTCIPLLFSFWRENRLVGVIAYFDVGIDWGGVVWLLDEEEEEGGFRKAVGEGGCDRVGV